MNYKYLFIDLDGTVSDSSEGIFNAIRYALAHIGVENTFEDRLHMMIGPPLVLSTMDILGFDPDTSDRFIKAYREYYNEKGILENRMYDGIPDFLRIQREKNRVLVLATSKPEAFAERILETFRIRDYFDLVAAVSFDGSKQEKIDVIRYAIEKLDIKDLSQVVMIGDTKYDIEGAKLAGIDSIGVLYGFGSEQDMIGATHMVKNLDELALLLG
jgi:phosphoglycolate phosphatase